MKNEANRLLGTLMHTRQTYFKILLSNSKIFYFVSILSYAFFIHAYFKFSPTVFEKYQKSLIFSINQAVLFSFVYVLN